MKFVVIVLLFVSGLHASLLAANSLTLGSVVMAADSDTATLTGSLAITESLYLQNAAKYPPSQYLKVGSSGELTGGVVGTPRRYKKVISSETADYTSSNVGSAIPNPYTSISTSLTALDGKLYTMEYTCDFHQQFGTRYIRAQIYSGEDLIQKRDNTLWSNNWSYGHASVKYVGPMTAGFHQISVRIVSPESSVYMVAPQETCNLVIIEEDAGALE